MSLQKEIIIIGISSGIAAYKVLNLIKLLKSKGCHVFVIMTEHAAGMISPSKFAKVSGYKVYTSLFPEGFNFQEVLKTREVEHIEIAGKASILVIAPATANVIGKIASGIADDFLTTTLLATTASVLICPSMNTHMWQSPLVQENVKKLKRLGYYILPPEEGKLACGYEGVGRLVDPNVIANEIFYLIKQKNKLKGKKIMVTAGGTLEAIDAVRAITNRASGKMGAALAEACFMQGADVLLLRAKTAVTDRFNIKSEIFETAKDLENLIKKYAKDYDVIFHTAAVSDFLPEKKIDEKLDSNKSLILRLKPTSKILHKIKSWNPEIKLIGFKAVYKLAEEKLINEGIKKLKESKADYIVVNDVGREGVGFAVNTNEVYIISQKGLLTKIPKAPKTEVARKILDIVDEHSLL